MLVKHVLWFFFSETSWGLKRENKIRKKDTDKNHYLEKKVFDTEELEKEKEEERSASSPPCSNSVWQMDCWVWGLLCFLVLVFVEKKVTAAFFFCSEGHQGQTDS